MNVRKTIFSTVDEINKHPAMKGRKFKLTGDYIKGYVLKLDGCVIVESDDAFPIDEYLDGWDFCMTTLFKGGE